MQEPKYAFLEDFGLIPLIVLKHQAAVDKPV